MKNTYKDIDKANAEAQKALEDAKAKIKEIEAQKQYVLEEQKQQKIQERKHLFEDAKKLRDDAIVAIKANDFTKAESLKGFAEDIEKQARAIVIDGEEIPVEAENQSPVFQEGLNLKKVLVVLITAIWVLYFLSGYINHRVQFGVKNISISIGAEWVHALLTSQFFLLAWVVPIATMAIVFRSFFKFINPKSDPDFDLTTKLFTECAAIYQIIISLLLLLAMVFSWCMIYLHNPVSNAG